MFEFPICLKTLLTQTDQAVMGTTILTIKINHHSLEASYVYIYIIIHIHICMCLIYNCSLQSGETNQAFREQNEVVKKQMLLLTWINTSIIGWTMTLWNHYLEVN